MMRKIPNVNIKENNITFEFADEELVEITNDSGIIVEMQYPILNLKHSIQNCYVRRTVYDMLIKANSSLPKGYKLKIWDAYRPFELQEELYYKYKNKILKDFNALTLPKEEQEKLVSQFVSIPMKDEKLAPLHTTGGAVDLTLVKDGKDVNMGAEFDEFSNRTYSNYYEKNVDEKITKNRRILYNAMIDAGFTNLPSEFWHYSYGDKIYASINNKPIKYKGIWQIKTHK